MPFSWNFLHRVPLHQVVADELEAERRHLLEAEKKLHFAQAQVRYHQVRIRALQDRATKGPL